MPIFHLHTLGELRLTGPDADVLGSRRKELVLLAYLARRGRAGVPREELAALLWGEREEARARRSLRQALYRIRQAAGEALEADGEVLHLADEVVELDAALFERDIAEGRLRDAVARWGGDFLRGAEDVGGEAYRAWLEGERQALRQRLGWATERLVDAAAERAAWAEAAAWAERWTAALPFDERAQQRLVEALRLDGRIADARARHAAFVSRLHEELELEPGAEFGRLGRELERNGEPGGGDRAGAAPLFSPELVGRGAAFGELVTAWRAAEDMTPGAVLVEGDEGLGKTRLCAEFLRWVAGASPRSLVLQARAYEAESAVSYAAVRRLLGALPSAAGLSGAPDAALGELSALVPALRERFPRLPEPTGDAAVLARALRRVLGDVAAEAPVLLLLDDLSAADLATRSLLLALARDPPPGVLMVLTGRTDALRREQLSAALHELPAVRRLELEPLGEAEVEALVASMLELPAPARRELAIRLHRESRGNPFYVVELVTTLADVGLIALGPEGTWQVADGLMGGPLPLPSNVRDVIRARLDRLDRAARPVLDAAAVLEPRIDPAVLEDVAGLPAEELLGALDKLVGRLLLREAAATPGGYEFSHAMIGRVAYELLHPARRLALHRAALESLQRRPREDPEVATAIQHHRAAVGAVGHAPHRGRRLVAAALTVVVALGAAAGLTRLSSSATTTPVLAVGAIRDFSGTDSVAQVIPDLLATDLARAPALQVVSTARMYELLARQSDRSGAPATHADAARRAGATHLVEGALYRRSDGSLRLDLRRVDLEGGAVRGSYTAAGADPFMLVDQAADRIIAELRLPAPAPRRVAGVTTRSLVAFRFYQEGLRAFFLGDLIGARRLLDAALEEDSTFAMAAYYAGRSLGRYDVGAARRYFALAHELSEHASEPEALLIRAEWAGASNDPAQLAIAETLAIRYPTNPDGPLMFGHALIRNGEFMRAVPHLRRVIELDSAGSSSDHPHCRACEAFGRLVTAYTMADSIPAAQRAARDWIRHMPHSSEALHALAEALQRNGCSEEAVEARRRAFSLQPSSTPAPWSVHNATCAMRAGDFAEVDRLLRADADAGSAGVRREALWYLTISLRHQGRLREALHAARRYEEETDGPRAPGAPPTYSALHRTVVLFELGRHGAAAALLDSLARLPYEGEIPTQVARTRTWTRTHLATALHAAGDTAALGRVVEELQRYGTLSGYGRDRRMHHHARGLLWAARGRPAEAEAAFRQALYSPTVGYTRTNVELARVLLAHGRPGQAVDMLRPALRGGFEAMNLYATHTELREALGQAFEAAGQPDSAAVHDRWVLNAWQRADPEFHARRDSVSQRLERLGRGP